MPKGAFTRSEIASQPVVWKVTLDEILDHKESLLQQLKGLDQRPFVVTGCGSTYYLALHTASVLRSVGINALALPASELAFFPMEHLPKDFVFLAISRSGTTTETLWAMAAYRRFMPDNGRIITITCVPGTPMIEQSDVVLVAPEAQEVSVAQTRSFTAMVIMAQILTGLLTRNDSRLQHLTRLPEILKALLQQWEAHFEALGSDLSIDRIFYLGSGPFHGIASECMLKTKEMTCSWAEVYHVLEFRHGPMSVVTPGALVVGLISDSAAKAEVRVLSDMKAKGARTLAFCEQRGVLDWSGVDEVVEVHSGLTEWERAVVYLPLVQWFAFYRSLAKGLNPDAPVNLTQVVVLE
jgi:glucosamine--fructose-6-phosphate aminotransferase (isomerizing)